MPQNDRRVVEGFRPVQARKLPVDTRRQDGARDSVAMPAPDQASVQAAQTQQAQHRDLRLSLLDCAVLSDEGVRQGA